MTGWSDLERELDRFRADGRVATLWWRDDDATEPSPALDRLLALAHLHDVPLALAVIPAKASAALEKRLSGESAVSVLQHGYAHLNHAAPGEKKCELADTRPLDLTLDELKRGWLRLRSWPRALPVLAPPWNRIAPALVERLPEAGFRGLSGFGARAPAPVGLAQANTHLDPIDWRGDKGFVGWEAILAAMIEALAGRRDASEPCGLLTHHAQHAETVWDFVGEFLKRTRAHAGVRWVGAQDLFGEVA